MKHAASTILSRVFITIMGLFTTMAVGQRLGAAGLGDVSLVVLGVTVIMLVNNLVGGGALVWFTPRADRSRLLVPAYGWAVFTIAIAAVVLWSVPLVPVAYRDGVLVMAALQCVYGIHMNLLLGQQRIMTFNIISAVQAMALLVAFMAIGREIPSAHDYVLASIIAFTSTLLLSAFTLFSAPYRRRRRSASEHDEAVMPSRGPLLVPLLRQGVFTQAANTLQLLNYRISYWLINAFSGTAQLGVFSVATQFSEASLIAPRGLGSLLHSRVSNSNDAERQRQFCLLTLKASLLFSTLVIAFALFIPDALIRSLFGKEITGLRPLILLLAPGMLAMSASQAFSHWFTGTARNRHNTIASAIGLMVTLVAGFLTIPLWGLRGAAITASLAYTAHTIHQAITFRRITNTHLLDLLVRGRDIRQFASLLRNALKR